MSLANWLGLPEAFQTTLLIAAVVLALTPYFAGITVGGLQVPRLPVRQRRRLRLAGPIVLLGCLALVIPIGAWRNATSELRLLAVDVGPSGVIDVVVANRGSSPALLTAIELEVIADRRVIGRPVLQETATYHVPLDDVAVGGRQRRTIRHIIAAGATERILIAPETARSLRVRLSLSVAGGAMLTSTVELLP